MPTVASFRGFRVAIQIKEHGPAHVHVFKDKNEAVFILNCPSGPLKLRENVGFKRSELGDVADELAKRLPSLCRKWTQIHGNL